MAVRIGLRLGHKHHNSVAYFADGTASGLHPVKIISQLLGLATRRIPSPKGEQVSTPGSTNLHAHSALMATPPPPRSDITFLFLFFSMCLQANQLQKLLLGSLAEALSTWTMYFSVCTFDVLKIFCAECVPIGFACFASMVHAE